MARFGQLSFIGRVFASAVARRLAYVLVAGVLAWCGMGRANAQDFGTQGAAYSACMSQTAAYLASRGRGANDRNPECNVEQGSQAYRGQFESRDCASCDWFGPTTAISVGLKVAIRSLITRAEVLGAPTLARRALAALVAATAAMVSGSVTLTTR